MMKRRLNINFILFFAFMICIQLGCNTVKHSPLAVDHIIFATDKMLEEAENTPTKESRVIVKRNWKHLVRNQNGSMVNGVISLLLSVNKSGKVIYSAVLEEETTITDLKFLKRAIVASMGYELTPDDNAAEIEYYNFKFTLDIKGR